MFNWEHCYCFTRHFTDLKSKLFVIMSSSFHFIYIYIHLRTMPTIQDIRGIWDFFLFGWLYYMNNGKDFLLYMLKFLIAVWKENTPVLSKWTGFFHQKMMESSCKWGLTVGGGPKCIIPFDQPGMKAHVKNSSSCWVLGDGILEFWNGHFQQEILFVGCCNGIKENWV